MNATDGWRGLLACLSLSALLTVAAGQEVLFGGRTFVLTALMTGRPPWAPVDADDAAVPGRLHQDISECFAMNAGNRSAPGRASDPLRVPPLDRAGRPLDQRRGGGLLLGLAVRAGFTAPGR